MSSSLERFSWSKNSVGSASTISLTQQLDLAEDPLGVDEVVEGVGDFLDGYLLPCLLIQRGANHPVGATAHHPDELVLFVDREGSHFG